MYKHDNTKFGELFHFVFSQQPRKLAKENQSIALLNLCKKPSEVAVVLARLTL